MSLLPWSQSANIIENERQNGTRQEIHLSSDGYTMLFTGHNGSSAFHALYRFNFDANKWLLLHKSTDEVNLFGFTGALNSDGTVYILGSPRSTVNIKHNVRSDPIDHFITGEGLKLFGINVAINGNGNRVAVLAQDGDDNCKVYVYDFDETSWNLLNTINVNTLQTALEMSSDGQTILVSTKLTEDVRCPTIFKLNTTTNVWTEQIITPDHVDVSIPQDHSINFFGNSIALSRDGKRLAFTLIHKYLDGAITRYLAKLLFCELNVESGEFVYIGRIESLRSSAAKVGAVNLSRTGNMVAVGNDNGLNEDGIQTGTVQVFREMTIEGQWEQVGFFAGQELDENIGAATAFADNSRVVAMSSLGSALDEQQGVAFHPVILRVYNLPDAQLVTGAVASGSRVAISTSRIE